MFNKTSLFGCLSLLISLFLYIFHLLSHLMAREMNFFSIEELFGLDWIGDIPLSSVREFAIAVSTAQLYVVTLILGVGFLILSTFQRH
jgi:hypothetical protein